MDDNEVADTKNDNNLSFDYIVYVDFKNPNPDTLIKDGQRTECEPHPITRNFEYELASGLLM